MIKFKDFSESLKPKISTSNKFKDKFNQWIGSLPKGAMFHTGSLPRLTLDGSHKRDPNYSYDFYGIHFAKHYEDSLMHVLQSKTAYIHAYVLSGRPKLINMKEKYITIDFETDKNHGYDEILAWNAYTIVVSNRSAFPKNDEFLNKVSKYPKAQLVEDPKLAMEVIEYISKKYKIDGFRYINIEKYEVTKSGVSYLILDPSYNKLKEVGVFEIPSEHVTFKSKWIG